MFEKIIYTIATILGVMMALYGLYYIFIAMNYLRKEKEFPKTSNYHKFAVLIAARNEETVIAGLVKSLKKQDYPEDKFDIFVLPNNCKDDTKGAAIKAGALIYEPPLPVKSKGEVLHQSFDYLINNYDHEAYIVFDADNIVDKNYIKEMNKAYDAGVRIATGFRDSRNPTKTCMSSAYSIFYLIVNTFYNNPRHKLGMNSLLTGTGFMTSRDTLIQLNGWETYTITEDVEFTIQNSLEANHIDYVPKAITYDEQPEGFIAAWHQRLRWSLGSQQNFKLHGKDLISATINKESKNSFDMFIMLLATYMQIAGLFAGIAVTIASFVYDFLFFLTSLATYTLGFVIAQALLAIIVLKLNNKPVLASWKGIISLWWFTLTWIPLHTIALFKDTIEWKEIAHTAHE